MHNVTFTHVNSSSKFDLTLFYQTKYQPNSPVQAETLTYKYSKADKTATYKNKIWKSGQGRFEIAFHIPVGFGTKTGAFSEIQAFFEIQAKLSQSPFICYLTWL